MDKPALLIAALVFVAVFPVVARSPVRFSRPAQPSVGCSVYDVAGAKTLEEL